MKKRLLCVCLAFSLAFSMSSCGKSEQAQNDKTIKEEKAEQPADESQTPQTLEEPQIPEEHEPIADSQNVNFNTFAGNYSFSSGAGAWATEVSIFSDGTFSGLYHDSDMGVTGDGYPNGEVYICKFSGKFTELVKKDDFTYTCSLESIEQEDEAGKEEIAEDEGIKYIYSFPYGFENAKDFEFYLPGKSVGELNNDLVTWLSIRFNQPNPDKLPNKVFCNLAENEGFEENGSYLEDITAEYPESLPIEPYQLAGSYYNENIKVSMNISAYSDYVDGDDACGNITWDIPDDVYIWNDDATFLPSDNGFDVKPEFYGQYKIIVTDNTDSNVIIHLYDDNGIDCGEYVMTSHFES